MNIGPPGSPWTHYPTPLMALVHTLAAAFASGLVIALLGSEPSIATIGVGEAVGLSAIGALVSLRVPPPHRERIGLQGFDRRFVPMLALLVPVIVVFSEVDNVVRAVMPPVETPEAIAKLQEELGGDSWVTGLELVIVAVGIAPVVEEWFFRGVLQQGLVARLGRFRGVLLGGVLYAIVHVGPAPSGSGALSPFLSSLGLGMVFGTVRLATGSIVAPMVLAAACNAFGLAAVGLSDAFPMPGFNAPGSHTPAWLLLPAVVTCFFGLRAAIAGARAAPVALPFEEEGARTLGRDED